MVEIAPTDHRSPSRSFETGDDGRFDFGGVPLGKYELSAAKRGYLTQSYQQHEDFSTAIAVGPERMSEDLVFHLMPQAIFYGTVNDEPASLSAERKFTSMRIETVMGFVRQSNGRRSSPMTAACMR